MIRFCLGILLLALLLNSACAQPGSIPAPTLQPGLTGAPTAVLTVAPAAPSPVCEPFTTPQPTPSGSNRSVIPTRSFDRPRFPIPAGRSQLVHIQFHSATVDQDMPMLVYLPPGYADTRRRYPVLYMLSGFDGDEHEWVNWGLCDAVEFLTRGGQIQPMIVAMPGGDHSWWFNHAPPPGGDGRRWGDYVWKDVVQEMDAKFRTLPAPSSRAIGGLSAGGQSALMLAMTHPEVFGIVGAHSPSFRGADGSVPNFGTWDYFNQYDPIWLAEHSDGVERLSIWVDIGGDDTQWRDCNPPPSPQRCAVVFNQILNTRDIPHQWHADWPGIHDDYYWGAHLVDYLTWYSSVLASGPP